MDIAFISGMGAFVSSTLIFVGSAFLLLMLILGARLAYLITASVTLAFLLIMGVVWSINPLGPVGQLPSWEPVAAAEDVAEIDFGPAGSYPEGEWAAPAEGDQEQATQASELESEATAYVEAQAGEGKIAEELESPILVDDTTRLLEQGGDLYGATTVSSEDDENLQAVVVAKYDPGNPLGKARAITLGILILLVVHLFLLSSAERRHAKRREEVQTA